MYFFSLCVLIFIVVVLSYGSYNDKKELKKLKRDIAELSLSSSKKNRKESDFKLNGIFEVHITIDHSENYVRLLDYIKNHQSSKNMKVVFATTNAKNNQYMISYFTRKDDDILAVNHALATANEMKQIGIKVSRVKVESHNAQGTPMTKEEYYFAKKCLNRKYNFQNGKPYFEFHVKIGNKKDSILNYAELENVVKKFTNVGISYNLCSSSEDKKPLLTIRVFDEGFNGAQAYKDDIMNYMKKIGYIFEDKIQQEFSIYDSCSSIDEGWL